MTKKEAAKPFAGPNKSMVDALPFMKGLGQQWRHLELDSEYVPKIGSHIEFTPKPKTESDTGNVLALAIPCGRGKSSTFREYMKELIKRRRPNCRILLLSANITYGTHLAHELKHDGFDVGFYKDKNTNLASHQVVVCSLESLHHVDGQRFEAMLIDEACTIANIVGGGTMHDFTNLVLLRELCTRTPEIVVCDADLEYTVDTSEPVTKVYDFLQFVAPDRPVLCVTLSHPGPPHLKRSARLFYDCKAAVRGKEEWLAELKSACAAQRDNSEHRIAVCVGSKTQLREVCQLLTENGVSCKPYSGETHEGYRLDDLKDPDHSWLEVGSVVSTTTLSIGVDPKQVQFARVFMWTCRMGCNVISQAQAVMRFGRSASAPLLNTTIDILVDCMEPSLRATLVDAKKLAPLAIRCYDDEKETLQKRKGKRLALFHRMMMLGGGELPDVKRPLRVDDQIIRIMAHHLLERSCQMGNIAAVVKRVCQHHGWELDDTHLSEKATLHNVEPVELDEDDAFSSLLEQRIKFEKGLEYICEHGESGFFDDCYQMEKVERKSGKQQFLIGMYWLLQPIGRLVDAETLVLMSKKGVLPGLRLNALSRCRTPIQQMELDRANRLDPMRKKVHPLLKTDAGCRMEAAQKCAALLEVESLINDCEMPRCVVDMINRERRKTQLDADAAFLQRLRAEAVTLCDTNRQQLESILADIAMACGMKLDKDEQRTQKDGIRDRGLVRLSLVRVLPDVVDDWLVKSDRLGKRVRAGDWETEHADLDEEEQQMKLLEDAELDEELFAAPVEFAAAGVALFANVGAKNETCVLLAREKRGNKVRLNFIGGKREVDETARETAAREVWEECAGIVDAATYDSLANKGDAMWAAWRVPESKYVLFAAPLNIENIGQLIGELPEYPIPASPNLIGLQLVPIARLFEDEWTSSHMHSWCKPMLSSLLPWLEASWDGRHEEAKALAGHQSLLAIVPRNESKRRRLNDTDEERTERIDGVALDRELRRLSGLKAPTAQEKRWLDFLIALDAAAIPSARPGSAPHREKHLRVVYGKRRTIGRRTASYPSMQHCPSGLRPLLVGRYYHDIDIVSCHPTLFAQVAKKMGIAEREIAPLIEYVEDSFRYSKECHPMLRRIGEFYGVPAAKCKYAVLRLLNGGSLMAWIRDTQCTQNTSEEQTDLREMQRISVLVRAAFFQMPHFKQRIGAMKAQITTSTTSKVTQAEAQLAAAKTPHAKQSAKETLRTARHKATPGAVERTVFSLCVFELEDMILDVIDRHFRTNGWTVASLQFDGLHVEHKDGVQLQSIMDGAEEQVRKELDFKIKLVEKELYLFTGEIGDEDAMEEEE